MIKTSISKLLRDSDWRIKGKVGPFMYVYYARLLPSPYFWLPKDVGQNKRILTKVALFRVSIVLH